MKIKMYHSTVFKGTDLQTNVKVFAKPVAFFSDNCTFLPLLTHRDGGLASVHSRCPDFFPRYCDFSSWI